MQSKATSVNDYLESLPPDRRRALARLRTLIKRAAPTAQETMKHGMAHYEQGGMVFAFAAQKNYLALYVADEDVVLAHKDKLGNVSLGKNCIRFKSAADLSFPAAAALLNEVARARGIAGID